MLKRAQDNMPESIKRKERFEIPKVRGQLQGAKTIISNIHQIADTLHRPLPHLIKFITKELATRADVKKNAAIFQAKIPASRINDKVRQYANAYVVCADCGKPDTKLLREGSFLFMRCQACGSKRALRNKI